MNGDMRDLNKRDKQLILHSAYYAIALHNWRDSVLNAEISDDVKRDLIGKFPCGDPVNNLMNLAEKLLPEFDGNKTIKENIEIIKMFVYCENKKTRINGL